MAQATVTIEGFTAKDAELRFTKAGEPVLGFSIPVTPQRKTDNGWEDSGETVWYSCSLWGSAAETYLPLLAKGSRVKVTGNLTGETYNDKQQFRVRVEQIGFVESRKKSSSGFSQAPGQPAPAQTTGWTNAQTGQPQDPWATSAPAQGGGFADEPPF